MLPNYLKAHISAILKKVYTSITVAWTSRDLYVYLCFTACMPVWEWGRVHWLGVARPLSFTHTPHILNRLGTQYNVIHTSVYPLIVCLFYLFMFAKCATCMCKSQSLVSPVSLTPALGKHHSEIITSGGPQTNSTVRSSKQTFQVVDLHDGELTNYSIVCSKLFYVSLACDKKFS